jgi:pimeloyl-ACP methyl ester carboxylesterase
VAPKHAHNTAKKLLLTPARLAKKNPEPKGLIKDTLLCREGQLQTYRLGTGPIWLLTHGWSGSANQFLPLMEHIAKQGYTAFAYDHPGHGESEGSVGHIPAFVHGLATVLDNTGEVKGLIGHSMGTASAIECQHPHLADKPFLLIAPVLNYVENLHNSIARSGYSMRLFTAVVREVEEQYEYPLADVKPFQKLAQRNANTIIVHDPSDRFAEYIHSDKAANSMNKVTLIPARGQGHGRIMKSQAVFDAFDLLNQA